MKQEIIDPSGTRNYEAGDIVYLWYDKGVPTCKAEFLSCKNGRYLFRAMEKQSFYAEKDGIIGFFDKPFIFAKETTKGGQKNDTF